MGHFSKLPSAKTTTAMKYLALSLVCLMTVSALPTKNIEVANSSLRQLGFCCGTVTSKCAQGCAGKSCDIQCSGTCGILNSVCGPYTCSAVTNACITSSATTAAGTASGANCLSITTGAGSACCGGAACNVFVTGVGFNCA